MASTYDALLRTELMAFGDHSNSWDVVNNTNIGTLLAQSIAGWESIATGDANVTLSANNGATDQARKAMLKFTGVLTANRNIVVPTSSKLYLIDNACTGSFSLVVKTTAGTGVTIPNGFKMVVYCDGTNVVDGENYFTTLKSPSATITGGTITGITDLTVADGGTGASVAALASSNIAVGPSPEFLNLGLSMSVASNALTIAIKGADGNDPSATNPVTMHFRSPTAATGTPVQRIVTAANSLVISSGSTMGAANSIAFRLWIVAFDDAGTIRLGAVQCRNTTSGNILYLNSYPIISSTAEGGAGAADSASVIYTGTAVSSKSFIILGCASWESGLATVGTWSSGPTRIELASAGLPRPGAIVQTVWLNDNSGSSTTSTSLVDVTGATVSIAPTSAANIVRSTFTSIVVIANFAATNTYHYAAYFIGGSQVSSDKASGAPTGSGGTGFQGSAAFRWVDMPNSTASRVYKIQHKTNSASATATTTHVNIQLDEIMS